MELRHLRYFVAVAEERHFGRAADRLHVAQPALSRQIRQLETEIGVQLLTRTTRRVELTDAGEAYVDRARAILTAVDAAHDEARRIAAGEQGTVSIGFTGSATYELLPRVSRVVGAALPDLHLRLHGELLTPAQVSGLNDGSLDLGLLRPPVRDPQIRTEPLTSEPLIVALPDSHRLAGPGFISLGDLAEESFISYPSRQRSVVHEVALAACAGAGFTPRIVQEATQTSALISLVSAGLGVALVPESVSHLSIAGIAYRPLRGTPPRVELVAAYRRGDASPQLARVLRIVRALFEDSAQ